MKLKRKSLIAAVLIASLSLAACGGSAETATNAPTTNSPTEKAAEQTPVEKPSDNPASVPEAVTETHTEEAVPEAVTYSDHRVLVVGNAHTHTEYYNSAMPAPDENDPDILDFEREWSRYQALKDAEEKYNVEIRMNSMDMASTTQSLSNSAMSSTPDYDYYFNDLQVAIPAVLAGYVKKLEDFVPADNDLWNGQAVFTPLRINGMPENETYLFMPSQVRHDAFSLGYNKTILEQKGLPDPLNLWNEGKWDWQTWRDMLIKTTDITGQKKTTVYGFGGFWSWFLDGMLMSNGASIAAGYEQTLTSAPTIEVLDFVNTMYNVDKTAQPWQESWNDNNNFKKGNLAFFVARDWILQAVSDDTGYEFGVVPFPVGPSGNKDTNKQDSLTGNVFMLPRNVAEPERVYNALFDTVNWFNYDTELRDGDLTELEDNVKGKTNLDTIMWMSQPEKTNIDIWLAINQGDDAFSLVPLMNGEVTPAQLAETYKNWFQTLLDQAYKK
ncbi:hypothetical protein FACS189490_11940 [Clostridia bacterium]|nr:hypothetical protein FACS189490_11940 [Clostridia bacterium]